MPTIIERIRTFLRSPRGQGVTRQVSDQLRNPATQRRLRQLAQRLRGRR
jgi:hypothetical protein